MNNKNIAQIVIGVLFFAAIIWVLASGVSIFWALLVLTALTLPVRAFGTRDPQKFFNSFYYSAWLFLGLFMLRDGNFWSFVFLGCLITWILSTYKKTLLAAFISTGFFDGQGQTGQQASQNLPIPPVYEPPEKTYPPYLQGYQPGPPAQPAQATWTTASRPEKEEQIQDMPSFED